MAENTRIEWTDATFNPWIGCTKISPGCDDCYAARSTPARSMRIAWGAQAPRRRTGEGNWALPRRWERRHDAFFAAHGRRRRVFCASLADVFDNAVPIDWRADLFALIRSTPNLDWMLLTKRIGNVEGMATEAGGWPANAMLGLSIVNDEEARRDIPKGLRTKVALRIGTLFLSMEPLLGPVILEGEWLDAATAVGWIIAGGESGALARPAHPAWFRSLRDQCARAGIPFLFKQWGEWTSVPEGGGTGEPFSLFDGTAMHRVGKKTAGRLLDGTPHDGMPKPR